MGYRWFDAKGIEPAFAFGYGLSYTSFAYRDLGSRPAAGGRPAATVTARSPTPAGAPAARSRSCTSGCPSPGAGVNQPPRQLKGFERVRLNPGQEPDASRSASNARDLSYWSTAANDWRVAPGCYSVQVGRLVARHPPARRALPGRRALSVPVRHRASVGIAAPARQARGHPLRARHRGARDRRRAALRARARHRAARDVARFRARVEVVHLARAGQPPRRRVATACTRCACAPAASTGGWTRACSRSAATAGGSPPAAVRPQALVWPGRRGPAGLARVRRPPPAPLRAAYRLNRRARVAMTVTRRGRVVGGSRPARERPGGSTALARRPRAPPWRVPRPDHRARRARAHLGHAGRPSAVVWLRGQSR